MRYVARFSFSFLIVGILCMYLALLSPERYSRPEWQKGVLMMGAVICVFVGLLGIRERHRE